MKEFKSKMQQLATAEIVEAMRKTWDMPEGGIFREVGFEIIEERDGEEESDRIYSELWNERSAA